MLQQEFRVTAANLTRCAPVSNIYGENTKRRSGGSERSQNLAGVRGAKLEGWILSLSFVITSYKLSSAFRDDGIGNGG